MNTSLTKALPYILGGTGLAALENKFIGGELPPELKNVNYGIGGLTGYLVANPSTRLAALSSLPLKQLGLFGFGSMDKFRRQQQGLVDANLDVARTDRQTAGVNLANAGSNTLKALMFLIPALAAGAGVGYLGYDRWKKNKKQVARYGVDSEKGPANVNRKIRIDIPPSALPPEFFESLRNVDDQPRARTRVMSKNPMKKEGVLGLKVSPPAWGWSGRGAERRISGISFPTRVGMVRNSSHPRGDGPDVELNVESQEFLRKLATAERFSIPGFVGNLAAEITGVPSAWRSAQDAGAMLGTENNGQALRYGLGALGQGALALVAARTGGLPLLARVFGKARLAGVLNGKTNPLSVSKFPGFARGLYVHGFGNQLKDTARATGTQRLAQRQAQGLSTMGPYDRMLRRKGRYDPSKYAWNPSVHPKGLAGQLSQGVRYGVNRAIDTGYRTRQLMKRNPNISTTLWGMAAGSAGLEHDKAVNQDLRRRVGAYLPDYLQNRGPNGMPISSTLGSAFSLFGARPQTAGLSDQLRGFR